MTSREKGLLTGGICLGIAIAATLFLADRFMTPENAAPFPPAEAPAQTAMPPDMTGGASGPRTMTLTAEEQAKIGLEVTEVRARSVQREILANARVDQAETALNTISARIAGRIDQLFVNVTGQNVSRGQPVASIYSPQVASAAEEYRLALDHRRALNASPEREAISQADELVTASRRKLELWGLTTEQLASIATTADAQTQITIYSPVDGVITERLVTEGEYVEEGDALLEVSDLSTVWVRADVYQFDMADVRVGQAVTITSEALPGTRLRGTVNFIELQANADTRTVPVRIQVQNPQRRLRPGMYVQAAFNVSTPANTLTVPRSAVIDRGTEKIVYVDAGDGRFEGRAVEVGAPDEDVYPVVSGLMEGDRVVTHGAFLIDSQTRLSAGMTGLFGGAREFASGRYDITLSFASDPPRGAAANVVRVRVTDMSGVPVSDAEVTVLLVMPAMPSMGMPEMRSSAPLMWNGAEYVGEINVSMAGPWNVTVEARRGGELLGTAVSNITAR